MSTVAARELLETLQRGPQGGDLTHVQPTTKRVWRQSELTTEPLPNGGMSLHRFERQETTAPPIKNEQVWHRMAALMILAGRTNSEIAAASDRSAAQVSFLRGQKWFQQLLATMANEAGEDILGSLKSYALEAVEGIRDIAVNGDKETNRLNAFRTLLEHATGKPIQKVISDISHSVSKSASEEMEEIRQQLAAIRSRSPT